MFKTERINYVLGLCYARGGTRTHKGYSPKRF